MDKQGTNFTFNSTLACSGPSAILCNGNPVVPPTPTPTPSITAYDDFNNLFTNEAPAVTYITAVLSNLGTSSTTVPPTTSNNTQNNEINEELDSLEKLDFFNIGG